MRAGCSDTEVWKSEGLCTGRPQRDVQTPGYQAGLTPPGGSATEEAEANQTPDSSSELSERASRSHFARKEGNFITVLMVYLRITSLR